MTYEDAKDFLHIAENAFQVGAYTESAQIVQRLAYFAINSENGLTSEQNEEIRKGVILAIGRFTDCPDESIWEDTCGLIDLFR